MSLWHGGPCTIFHHVKNTFVGKLSIFIQEIFYDSVYQLNKDYTVSIDSDESSDRAVSKEVGGMESFVTYFNVGTNEIKWKGKSLTYEVKEVASIFYGLCQTIWPKNVLLEPGDRYAIYVHSNLTLKGCKLFSWKYCPWFTHFILLRKAEAAV